MLNSSSLNPASSPPNNHTLTVLDAQPVSARASTSDLQSLLGNGSLRVKEQRALIQCRTVEPADPPAPAVLCADLFSAPPPVAALRPQRLRNGKIARLPKLERDMVNKLLHTHAPYSKIVWALAELGITVTERNISNWRTRGGYQEWCAQQDNQLRLAHLQDHLTDYLRQHDAQQLPEVGLQVASTQLTSLLLNPQTAAPLLADPDKYAKIVQTLDKCAVRLTELQELRYETARRAGYRDTIPNLLHEQAREVENLRQIASAASLANSGHEDNVPHRNDLPPREEMPYSPPAPNIGELLRYKMSTQTSTSKSPAAAPSEVPPGNPE